MEKTNRGSVNHSTKFEVQRSRSTAPWLFTRVAGVVKELFHKDRLSLFQYLNNWLGDAQSKCQAPARCVWLVRLCTHLGFLINFEKSELVSTQKFNFVGINFDLRLHQSNKPLQSVVSNKDSPPMVAQPQETTVRYPTETSLLHASPVHGCISL